MTITIGGQFNNFFLRMTRKYYDANIQTNSEIIRYLVNLEPISMIKTCWLVIIRCKLDEEEFPKLIELLSNNWIRYTYSVGPVSINKYGESHFVLKGYVKSFVHSSLEEFKPVSLYCPNNEEYYAFRLGDYPVVLEKLSGIPFTNNLDKDIDLPMLRCKPTDYSDYFIGLL